ncbi:hypothetical protein Bpfe_012189, partial [Biomphalaria pfeifferi]
MWLASRRLPISVAGDRTMKARREDSADSSILFVENKQVPEYRTLTNYLQNTKRVAHGLHLELIQSYNHLHPVHSKPVQTRVGRPGKI